MPITRMFIGAPCGSCCLKTWSTHAPHMAHNVLGKVPIKKILDNVRNSLTIITPGAGKSVTNLNESKL